MCVESCRSLLTVLSPVEILLEHLHLLKIEVNSLRDQFARQYGCRPRTWRSRRSRDPRSRATASSGGGSGLVVSRHSLIGNCMRSLVLDCVCTGCKRSRARGTASTTSKTARPRFVQLFSIQRPCIPSEPLPIVSTSIDRFIVATSRQNPYKAKKTTVSNLPFLFSLDRPRAYALAG